MDLLRRAAGKDPAIGHDDHGVAKVHHHFHVMLDDEDGATVAKSRGKKRGELLAAFVAVALRQHV